MSSAERLFTITRCPTEEGELFMKKDLCLNDSETRVKESRERKKGKKPALRKTHKWKRCEMPLVAEEMHIECC